VTTIDIPIPDAVREQLAMPRCVDIRVPKPKLPQLRLPTGGSIKGVADLTKGIPSDCSLNFSLALQVAPIMASIECLVKVLKLIKPLIDVVGSLGPPPDPIKLPKAIKDFLDAAVELAPCLLVPTPAVMLPFVKDILQLIIKLLGCVLQQLESIAKLIGRLELRIASARSSGNTALLDSLECARENAVTSAQSAMQGIEPVAVLLELAGPFMGIAGVDPIVLPGLASPEDAAALNDIITTLRQIVDALQAVVDALP
jgi:hypothetical protein